MITEYDERVYIESEYIDDFLKCIPDVFNYLRNIKQNLKSGDRMSVKLVSQAFDECILDYGFELDGRTLRHAHGIGNNNEWDVVDKNLIKVGDFFCTDDMYGGVITGVTIKGEIIHKIKMR